MYDDEGLGGLGALVAPPGTAAPRRAAPPARTRPRRGVLDRLTRSVRKRADAARDIRETVDEARGGREREERAERERGFPWGKLILGLLGIGGAVLGARALARRRAGA